MAYLRDAVSAFRGVGVSVVQNRFPTNQEPPYAVFVRIGDARTGSDNKPMSEYEAILFTHERDLELEFSIEDALAESHVPYGKGRSGIDSGATDLSYIPFENIYVNER